MTTLDLDRIGPGRITVNTAGFIDILTDLLHTSGVHGIHLATHRAPAGDEPGDVDMLAGVSTTGTALGHTWMECGGQFGEALVWPEVSAHTVLAVCKSLAVKGKDHTVDIAADRAEDAEDADPETHPGWTVSLSETPALFDTDTEFTFHAEHESQFPIGGIRRVLLPNQADAKPYTDGLHNIWSPGVLEPLLKVAKRRKKQLQLFRSPDRRVQLAQIGDDWIGAAIPQTPLSHATEPSIEPLLAEPADDAAADLRGILADMKADGITVTIDNPRGDVAKTLANAVADVDPRTGEAAGDGDE